MPRRADHDQRRQQIAAALLRIAAARGLHNAGLREVAAEAGVSVRLIQYYFGTKEQLLLFTTQYLAEQLGERMRTRIHAAGSPPGPRTVIEAILEAALPDDEESRVFSVIYASYAALALTDPGLAMAPLVRSSDVVEKVIADQLAAGQQAGQVAAGLDIRTEAVSLLAISAGLSTSVLHNQRSASEARAILGYHLDRLFWQARP